MKALANPSDTVRNVGQMILLFKPISGSFPDGWDGARQMMGDPNKLLAALKEYGSKVAKLNDKIIGKIVKLVGNLDYETCKKVSKAAGGLFKWVDNTVKCYTVHKEVEPLQKKVKEMTEKSE